MPLATRSYCEIDSQGATMPIFSQIGQDTLWDVAHTKAGEGCLKSHSCCLSLGFMDTQTNVIVKIFLLSAAVSVLIKYGGPSLPVAATSINAWVAVLTPTLILAIALVWRVGKYGQPD